MLKSTLLFYCLSGVVCATTLTAQQRYLDASFDVAVSDPTVYATNISVLTGTPAAAQLRFVTYTPIGDAETLRPMVVLQSSGTFLPPLINATYTGSIRDSVTVETAKRLAARGYVAAIMEYRAGWNPASPDEPVRTGTLLNAAYRGGIDTRTMMRYLRKTVAEDSNPLRIDTAKIMVMGYGTGGYNVFTSNFLDSYGEVVLAKFLDPNNTPYVTEQRDGNPYGTVQAPLNAPNYPTYSSRYAFGVAVEGALGDSSWIDGTPDEAPVIAIHSPLNSTAPFADGDVNVFTGFVVSVAGSRTVIDKANRAGTNDALNSVNAFLTANNDFTTLKINRLKDVTVTTSGGVQTTAAVDNLLPIIGPNRGSGFYSSYNWIDTARLRQVVAGYNSQPGVPQRSATDIIQSDLRNNPNTGNAAGAKLVIDTIMSFVLPRAYAVLNLGPLSDLVSVGEVSKEEVSFEFYPNPVQTSATVRVNADTELKLMALYDVSGRRVLTQRLQGASAELDRGNLPAGSYFLFVETNRGTLAHPVLLQ